MFKGNKTITVILAASVTVSALCACNIGSSAGDPSLPTTESLDTSMTTSEMSETTSETTEITQTTPDGTYETAIDSTGIDTGFVRTMNDVTPEMMTADFWIDEDDNKLLMTNEEIAAFNYENRVHVKVNDDIYFPYFDELQKPKDY